MEVLNEFLKTKGIYSLVMILFFLGVYGMVLSKNYMKKLMAMNVMQVAVIYFYLCTEGWRNDSYPKRPDNRS